MTKHAKNEVSFYLLKKILVSKCIEDPGFKDRFLKNPKQAIEQEFKTQLPDDIKFNVYEDTNKTFNVVIPSKYEIESEHKKEYELSDAELRSIAGGMSPHERRVAENDYINQIESWNQGWGRHPGPGPSEEKIRTISG